MSTPFKITLPSRPAVPLIISVPHCGTRVPPELTQEFNADALASLDDTDWFVDRLYDFATDLGIPMIAATYSRWVIDLNRDPDSKPLYSDGRIITGLCPVTDFRGNSLYADQRVDVERKDRTERLERYYWPYHLKLEEMLAGARERFGAVLLWDCHSIRRVVPTIQKDPFPDLILGSADGQSCGGHLIESAMRDLGAGRYQLSYNHPFKGGYITRRYGRPETGTHALQLEMTKVNYMDDAERKYDEARATEIRGILQTTLANLVRLISS